MEFSDGLKKVGIFRENIYVSPFRSLDDFYTYQA